MDFSLFFALLWLFNYNLDHVLFSDYYSGAGEGFFPISLQKISSVNRTSLLASSKEVLQRVSFLYFFFVNSKIHRSFLSKRQKRSTGKKTKVFKKRKKGKGKKKQSNGVPFTMWCSNPQRPRSTGPMRPLFSSLHSIRNINHPLDSAAPLSLTPQLADGTGVPFLLLYVLGKP